MRKYAKGVTGKMEIVPLHVQGRILWLRIKTQEHISHEYWTRVLALLLWDTVSIPNIACRLKGTEVVGERERGRGYLVCEHSDTNR